MLFLGSLEIMKWRQLFWITFCLLELSGNVFGNSTETSASVATATEVSSITAATGATGATNSTKPMLEASAVDVSLAVSPTSPGLGSEQPSPPPSQASTQPLSTSSEPDGTEEGVPSTESPSPQPSMMAETPRSTSGLTNSSATSEHPRVSTATTPLPTGRDSPDSPKLITCHNVKELNDTGAICLQLNESVTCKHFLERKGSDLWSAVCEGSSHRVPSPCQIQLAKSEVDHNCLLLILVGEKDPATDVLQESHWEKFGIKSLKRGSVRSHQDFSQKTLIALVTSGLLLAFLGLAGYFLMKRRSWSPAGERLAEDPYYAENGSQANTMLMMPPQEQPELQEKPNLNGGTQENGTGQASSKNSHSGRQHSPADTQM